MRTGLDVIKEMPEPTAFDVLANVYRCQSEVDQQTYRPPPLFRVTVVCARSLLHSAINYVQAGVLVKLIYMRVVPNVSNVSSLLSGRDSGTLWSYGTSKKITLHRYVDVVSRGKRISISSMFVVVVL